ncbi:hypothetical protein [Deinococcus marmoris]|uniref:hypothetical protein n=1 Tax=Deinococcus marmoris TaxID=249408 RepID=UPI0012DEDEAD|nr:hypothetical protein [Deinococcus marmoris]
MVSLVLIVLFGVLAIALLLAPRPSMPLSPVARLRSTAPGRSRADAIDRARPQAG